MNNPDYAKIFICGCCSNKFPSLYKHTHHKKPKALGGKDTTENMIDICPGCHNAIHGTAWKLLSKKNADARVLDSVKLIYKDNEKAVKTCIELALNIRNATLADKEKNLSPEALVTIATTVRKRHKTLIAARVSELKTSQEKYIRGLILGDLIKRFKLAMSITEENLLIKKLKGK